MRAIAILVLVVGCADPSLIRCHEDVLCPATKVCGSTAHPCVDREQLTACETAVDLDPCTTTAIADGVCTDGVCIVAGCGNSVVEVDELCDDGALLDGDGCSADCRSREVCGDGAVDPLRGEECDDANDRSHDGCTTACTREALTWKRWGPAPSQRAGAASAYDSARDRMVMFGGAINADTLHDETWEWNGATWASYPGLTPAPSARTLAAMAYDPVRRRMVLFGGIAYFAGYTSLADTWEWDGVTWRRIYTATTPRSRFGHALGWDPISRRIIMFGGAYSFGGILGDTWAWDGVDWRLITTAGPAPRLAHALVTDARRGAMLMVGGQDKVDTWSFDGAKWVAAAVNLPVALEWTAATYDLARQVVVLVGTVANGTTLRTFELRDSWSERAAISPPAYRKEIAIAFDRQRQRVVVWGGRFDNDNAYADGFEWDGTRWTPLPVKALPPLRVHTMMASDPVRGRVVLFGGAQFVMGQPSVSLGDTWQWDGESWTQRQVTGPSARAGAALAYHAATGTIVMFGGTPQIDTWPGLAETWTWNGTAWTRVMGPQPPARALAMMAPDPVKGTLLLFGGRNGATHLADTWEWNGTTWTQRMPTMSPPVRAAGAMAFDAKRNRIVLHGGDDPAGVKLGDTWEWDGAYWTRHDPAEAPEARAFHSMVYDPVRERIQVGGGFFLFDYSGWEWDGSLWKQPNAAVVPPAIYWSGSTYDDARRESIVAGGFYLFTYNDSTWTGRHRGTVEEVCRSGVDHDRDGTIGCADADCAAGCAGCGNGTCGTLETDRSCPADCPAAPALCGDYYCSPGEQCMTDCF